MMSVPRERRRFEQQVIARMRAAGFPVARLDSLRAVLAVGRARPGDSPLELRRRREAEKLGIETLQQFLNTP